jgi:hypothetical protein
MRFSRVYPPSRPSAGGGARALRHSQPTVARRGGYTGGANVPIWLGLTALGSGRSHGRGALEDHSLDRPRRSTALSWG